METSSGLIYAIGVEGLPFVKIGSTRGTIATRLASLQVGQPLPLHVIATVPVASAVAKIERHIHAALIAHHRKGEWFALSMDGSLLTALVAEALALESQTPVPRDDSTYGMMQLLGERIRKARRSRDLLQTELADKAALSVMTISRLEQGEARQVYAHTVKALAHALNVSADYLLGLTEKERWDAHT